MKQTPVIAFALAASAFFSGCASFGNGTLASELVNDHQPGTAPWAQPGAAALATMENDAGPAGAACRFGTDCRSGACAQGACEDFGDASSPGPVLVATHP